MKYMLMIISGIQGAPPEGAPPATEADIPAVMAQFEKLTAELQAQGKFHHSARLRPTPEAKTVRVNREGKRSVTDGPFTETKEAVGGYYMIDCANDAEALEWAKK